MVATIVTVPVMFFAKFSDWQATSNTDWLSTLIGDTSVYLVCGTFENPHILIFLAIRAISNT
jgi:hypothetical protein